MERSEFPKNVNVAELAAKLADGDQAAAYQAFAALQFACYSTKDPAKQAEKAALAAALAAELTAMVEVQPGDGGKKKKDNEKPELRPKHSNRVRNLLLQLLALVGTEAEVPALSGFLGDFELREAARMALHTIPGAAASQALAQALDKAAGPEFRIGLVNSLAYRQCGPSLEAIRKALDDADAGVRMAAVDALAKRADPAHDKLLTDAVKAGKCGCDAVCRARVRLAGNLADKGNKAAAKRIFTAVAAMKACKGPAKAAKLALAAL